MSNNNSDKSLKKALQFLKKELLVFFSQNTDRSFNYKQLSKALGYEDDESRKLIIGLLDELKNDGRIRETDRGRYAAKNEKRYETGIIEITGRGTGYLLTEEGEEDIMISKKSLKHALNGDTVKVMVFPQKGVSQPEGEVVEVITRANEIFVGRIEMSKKFAFLIPDNQKIHVDFFIPLDKLNGAKHNDKVLVKISDWPAHATSPFAAVTEVLGKAGENETEMHAILAEFGLPYLFPKQVEQAAERLNGEITEAEIAKRKDFRSITTFTIDPYDAKDFDDALSVRLLREDNGKKIYEIGVHIADVSHYVTPGSIIDKEAVERATSVYLVDRVVPMLPETLSNKLCSLRPHEEKLCFSVVFEMDEDTVIKKTWFGRTIIYSDRRFTYEEAQEIIEGKDGDLQDEIRLLDKMAKVIRAKRMKNGALEIHSTEVKFYLDAKGKPTGVFTKVSKDANKLIEEFMLLANKAVAKEIGEPTGKKKLLPMVYRVHDEPKSEKLAELKTFINLLGYKISSVNPQQLPDAIHKLLSEIKDQRVADVIQQYTIRSMAKAIYDIHNVGHYGLAFDYYTHFTSPIRRYPDLLVHRILQHYLDKTESISKSELERLCKHSSTQEKKAADAERASIKYKQVEFMKDKVGEIFEGIVSGVTEWGIYVEIVENKCEGMISLRQMSDDTYYYDEKTLSVRGVNKKKTFRLGSEVKIKVRGADLIKRQIDFVMM